MFGSNTDRDWEKFGKSDAYFGVITCDKYRGSNLTEENKEEFFKSGHVYIDKVLKTIRKHIDSEYRIKKALDFGCGVGRLVIPLAEVSESVTGIDVSDSMLNEARKNCEARSIKNVRFVKSDDNLSSLKNEEYDFIHSVIVFQHIPVKRGERIFENLMSHLTNDGVCVIHFTYATDYRIKKLVALVKNYVPFGTNLISLVKGKSFFAPQMQMNMYHLNQLFYIIQKFNVREIYTQYTVTGEYLGVILYFKKPGENCK